MIDKHTQQALAFYGEAERAAAASLVEYVAAAIAVKLNPPVNPIDVIEITLSLEDIESVASKFHFRTTYDDAGTMTMFITPLS